MSKEQNDLPIFTELSEYAQDLFNQIIDKMSMPFELKYLFVCNNKQKNLISVSKIPDVYSYALDKEVLVSINDVFVSALDEESNIILFNQEIDRLYVKLDTGKIKLNKPDLSTSVGVIKKFGIDAVARANKLQELLNEQKDDKDGISNSFENVKKNYSLSGKENTIEFLQEQPN